MPISQDDYVIRTRIQLDQPSGTGLSTVRSRLTGIGTLGRSISSSLTGSFMTAFAVIGGAAGLGFVARGFIGIQTEIQNAEIGIGTLVNAMSGMGIADSMSVAREQIGFLRADAAAGAGELNDYVRGFQMILGPAARAGASMKDVRDLTRQAITAGFALRGKEGIKLAGLDVVQAMTAGAGERTTPIIMQALNAIGKTAQEFNAMTGPQRMAALREAFGAFEEGAKAMGQTWDAQLDTFKDGTKDLLRTVTKPLFERWTGQLRGANEWLFRNELIMQTMAENWGPRLVAVWDTLIERAGTLASITATATGTAFAGRVAMGGLQMAGGAGGVGAAVGGVGAAAGGGALLGGGIIAGALALVAAGFVMVKGALTEYPAMLEYIGILAYNAMLGFENLTSSFGALTQEGSLLNITGLGLVAGLMLMGYYLLVSVDLLATFTRALGDLAVVLTLLIEAAMLAAQGNFAGARGAMSDVDVFTGLMLKNAAKGAADAFALEMPKSGFLDDLLGKKGQLKGPSGAPTWKSVTNIGKVEVTVKAEINEDPNRIAASFEEVLDRLARFKAQPARQDLASPA